MTDQPKNNNENIIGASATLKNAHVWEVTSPLPLNPLAGRDGTKGHPHFLPAQLTPAARRRRVSVEVHNVKSTFENSISRSSAEGGIPHSHHEQSEICYVRILEHRPTNPLDTLLDPIADRMKDMPKKIKAKKGTVNFFTGSYRHKESDATAVAKNHEDDSDDESVMAAYREQPSSVISTTDHDDTIDDGTSHHHRDAEVAFQPYEGWKPKYKLPLRVFNIIEQKKRSVIISFESKGHSSYREFIFDNENAVTEFVSVIEKNKTLLHQRMKTRVDAALGGITLKENEELTILFDICSGSRLPQSDIGKESDPYISVRFNGKKIHKTDFIPNTANPIWTLRKGALFIWKVNALELFQSEDGLLFEVKDYDAIGTNESLGAFNVNARTLYKWDGERREFALKPLLGQRDFHQGTIALRARRATAHDIEFLENYTKKSKKKIANSMPKMATGQGTAVTLKSIMTVHSKKGTFIYIDYACSLMKNMHMYSCYVFTFVPRYKTQRKKGLIKAKLR